MSDTFASPYVQVRVDEIRLRPGQTITVYVQDLDSNFVQVELRSVGVQGANVGQPEIFIRDGKNVEINHFNEWTPMDQAIRKYRGLPIDPQPATK